MLTMYNDRSRCSHSISWSAPWNTYTHVHMYTEPAYIITTRFLPSLSMVSWTLRWVHVTYHAVSVYRWYNPYHRWIFAWDTWYRGTFCTSDVPDPRLSPCTCAGPPPEHRVPPVCSPYVVVYRPAVLVLQPVSRTLNVPVPVQTGPVQTHTDARTYVIM